MGVARKWQISVAMANYSGNGDISGNGNGKWQMANDSGNVNVSGKKNVNGNVNEWQVPILYKQHELKTLTILDLFLLEIIVFTMSLRSLSLEASLVACI